MQQSIINQKFIDLQSYSPAINYDKILRIRNQTNKFCQNSRNLDDFSGNLKSMLDQVVQTSFKVFVVASEYDGLSTGLIGDVFSVTFHGFMPRFCTVNGSLINIIFWT